MAAAPDESVPYDGPIVAVDSFSNPIDAQWARIRLEEQGIPAFVEGENSAVLHEAPMPARLMVRGFDAERAREILANPDPEAQELEEGASPPPSAPVEGPDAIPAGDFPPARHAAVPLARVSPCPRCGSKDVTSSATAALPLRLLAALAPTRTFARHLARRRLCRDCGTSFTVPADQPPE